MVAPNASQQESDLVEQRLRDVEELLKKKEAELQERDRTVQELTARLSQAVERLDRVKRVGSDQNVIKTAAFPKEVVEQQTELVTDLKRAVEMWENMQLACSFGRFEMQLADLQALFEEHFRPEEPEPEEPESETSEQTTGEEDPAATLSEGLEEDDEDVEASADECNLTIEGDFLLALEETCPLRPPEILNLVEADVEALRRCVEQQDTYIDYLSNRLQRAAEKKTTVDWEQLSADPDKITRQLEYTATRFQQSKNFAEFELALQRTRLKRKERDLMLLSEELQSEMQNMDWKGQPTNDKDNTPNGQRWLRMLGVSKKE